MYARQIIFARHMCTAIHTITAVQCYICTAVLINLVKHQPIYYRIKFDKNSYKSSSRGWLNFDETAIFMKFSSKPLNGRQFFIAKSFIYNVGMDHGT